MQKVTHHVCIVREAMKGIVLRHIYEAGDKDPRQSVQIMLNVLLLTPFELFGHSFFLGLCGLFAAICDGR